MKTIRASDIGTSGIAGMLTAATYFDQDTEEEP